VGREGGEGGGGHIEARGAAPSLKLSERAWIQRDVIPAESRALESEFATQSSQFASQESEPHCCLSGTSIE
jgi:hypothetical protein